MRTIILPCILVICLLSITCGKKPPDKPPSDAIQKPVTIEGRLHEQSGDSLVKVEFIIKMAKNIHIFSSESHFFSIKTVESSGLDTPTLKLPQPKRYRNIDGTTADTYFDTVKIMLTCRMTARPWKMKGYVQYQACDKAKCFFPAKEWFIFSSSSAVGSIEKLSDSPPETTPDPEIGRE